MTTPKPLPTSKPYRGAATTQHNISLKKDWEKGKELIKKDLFSDTTVKKH